MTAFDPNRFSLEDAYQKPFSTVPLFRLPRPTSTPFILRKLTTESEEYSVISQYLQQTCAPRENKINPEKVVIYQYQRFCDLNLTRFKNANWLLWTGIRAENLENIKWKGLQLPFYPRRALFFTPSFASALKHTDLVELGTVKAGVPYRKLPYQERLLYVLLCEVSLGKPLFVKSRYFEMSNRYLDRKEREERIFWQRGNPTNYENMFPVTRYQFEWEKRFGKNFLQADDVVELAKMRRCNCVVTCHASMEPRDAQIWKGRVIPDGKLWDRRDLVEPDELNFKNCDFYQNHDYSEAFVWDASQVGIRYIVQFRADRIRCLEPF